MKVTFLQHLLFNARFKAVLSRLRSINTNTYYTHFVETFMWYTMKKTALKIFEY